MKLRRAPVVWKKDGEKVLIMSKQGVYALNEKASRLWESFDGGEVDSWAEDSFIKELLDAGLLEADDD